MKIRRISSIALSYRDFSSFEEKLEEACRWVSLAAATGSDLAVLPETLNLYRGDGPGNPLALAISDVALQDWQSACSILLECAAKCRIAVTVPLYVREGPDVLNCFYLVSKSGRVLGRYVKTCPVSSELDDGVVPAADNRLMDWDGIRVGGAICFDMNFPFVFQKQKEAGADLFLCPSLFHGGEQVNYYAASLRRPIVVAYPAWSRIVDLMGREVVGGGYRHETLRFGFGIPVYTADVNFDKAVFPVDEGNEGKMADIIRRYGRGVQLEFFQDMSVFTLESLSPSITVPDVIRAFQLVSMDEYLSAYLRRRNLPG
ncbi:MAG: carbon-nitrogen hydrolase family protein [Armatimonadetes bacterium]|nr:carbon-nitrogen hydrolase family protein [Armatimonadota bacterium]